MAMKKKPVTGMKDILPREMEIRDYCIREIKETYKGYIIKDNIYPEPPQQIEFAPDDEMSGDE